MKFTEQAQSTIETLANEIGLTVEALKGHYEGLDQHFMNIAARVVYGNQGNDYKENAFFEVIDSDFLQERRRPDSINHSQIFLQPNIVKRSEKEQVLGMAALMLGNEQTKNMVTDKFSDMADGLDFFRDINPKKGRKGPKLILLSNHAELADLGFHAAGVHFAAEKAGIENIENFTTVLVGRVIGYFALKEIFNIEEPNVIDGILRKAGSVLKTFPSGGGQGLTKKQSAELGLYRSYANRRTRLIHSHELMSQSSARLIIESASGEEDIIDHSKRQVFLRKFSEGTCRMLIEACNNGAIIVPLAAKYAPNNSHLEFLEPLRVTNEEQCHNIGESLAVNVTRLYQKSAEINPNDSGYVAIYK